MRAALVLVLLAVRCGAPSTPAPPTGSPPASPPPVLASPSPIPSAPATPATVTGLDQRQEPDLPAALEEGGAASAGGVLWVAGGFDGSGRSSAAVYRMSAGRWEPGPPLPRGVDHVAAATLGDSIYVAGGFASGPPVATAYRLDRGAWTALPPLRHARGAAALVAASGRLYVIGGSDGASDVAAVEELDPASASGWSVVASLPSPRNHLSGFQLDGRACVAGGRSPATARVDCLDPATRAWSTMPDLPWPTSGAGATALGATVVVAGGEDAAETAVRTQVAFFAGGRWTAANLLLPRHGVQPAVLDGRAWLCGGGSLPGLHPVPWCTSLAPVH